MSRLLLLTSLLLLALLMAPNDSLAQRYRYMDKSGNIHFVDSVGEVPREYRQQVVPPTPTPVLTDRQRRELQRKREQEVRDRQRLAEQKRREIAKIRADVERERKMRGYKPPPAGSQSQAPTSREDRIEVIH